MWFAADNHNRMCHICAKEVLYSDFNYALLDKMSISKLSISFLINDICILKQIVQGTKKMALKF